MSSLLLDDDDVFVPPTKTAKPEVQVLDSQEEAVSSTCVDAEKSPATVATSPAAAARTTSTQNQALSDAAAIPFARKGGNGMAKMEALLFGKPKVSVMHGNSSSSAMATPKRELLPLPLPVDNTPRSQTTPSAASRDRSSEVGSTRSTTTQPKVVSGARAPSSPSPLQRHSSAVSLDEAMLNSQDAVEVVEAHGATRSPPQLPPSPSSSPPARPPTKPVVVEEMPAVSTQPAKTQMKLSDFFSKMACKR